MGFWIGDLELGDDKEPIESVAKGSVGNALENERGEFAFHGINGIRC